METRDTSVTLICGKIVARLPADLSPEAMRRTQDNLLGSLQANRCRHAVYDLAQVEVMDDVDAATLLRMIAAGTLMGAAPVLCGLRPGVAAFLAGMDPRRLSGVLFARDLNDALTLENET